MLEDAPMLATDAIALIRRSRLAGASDLAVRLLQRLGRSDFAIALCRKADSEDDVCRWLAAFAIGNDAALAKAAQGKVP